MSDNPFAPNHNPSSSDANPYQAPQIMTEASDVAGSNPNLDGAADMLRKTKPWVRFISVMFFIGAAFSALGGIGAIAGGIAAGMAGGMPGGMPSGMAGGMPWLLLTGLGVAYIVMAILYITPGVFLWMYADRIGLFLRQKTPGRLASALASQKSFWKFIGIMTLIFICLYPIMILVVMGLSLS